MTERAEDVAPLRRRGDEPGRVCRLLGISKSHLCDIEKGRKLVSPERAARFAEILGYLPATFVRLALQDIVDRAELGLPVTVLLTPSSHRATLPPGRPGPKPKPRQGVKLPRPPAAPGARAAKPWTSLRKSGLGTARRGRGRH
jgi:hypothetical protein